MTFLDLFIITCASWYISYALVKTDGPCGVFEWLREHVWHGRHGVAAITHGHFDKDHNPIADTTYEIPDANGLLDCQICLIVWIALILTLAPMGIITYALAAAGLGLILHGFSGWRINL